MNFLTFLFFAWLSHRFRFAFRLSENRNKDRDDSHLFSFLLGSSYVSIDIRMHENGLNIPIIHNTQHPTFEPAPPYLFLNDIRLLWPVSVMITGDSFSFLFFLASISFYHCLHMEYGSLSIQLSWFCRSYSLAHCFFTVQSFRMHPFAPKKIVPHSHIFICWCVFRIVIFFFFIFGLSFPLKIVHWICAWPINSFGYYIKQMAQIQ